MQSASGGLPVADHASAAYPSTQPYGPIGFKPPGPQMNMGLFEGEAAQQLLRNRHLMSMVVVAGVDDTYATQHIRVYWCVSV